MNWKKIQEKYPKALKVCVKFFDSLPNEYCFNAKSWIHEFNDRNLYNFFDDQEIYCRISPIFDSMMTILFAVLVFSVKEDHDLDDFDTRIEAEKAAFKKAFELLEEKL